MLSNSHNHNGFVMVNCTLKKANHCFHPCTFFDKECIVLSKSNDDDQVNIFSEKNLIELQTKVKKKEISPFHFIASRRAVYSTKLHKYDMINLQKTEM